PGSLCWLGVSQALGDFLGRRIDSLARESVLESLHDDDRGLAALEIQLAAEEGERHDLVLRLRDRGGRWRYCRIHAQARYQHSGLLDHIRCNFKDVTDRVHDEQELRRRTEQLTAANEQLREANHRLQAAQ